LLLHWRVFKKLFVAKKAISVWTEGKTREKKMHFQKTYLCGQGHKDKHWKKLLVV